MKANKITMTITVEVLSADTIPGLLMESARVMAREFTKGELTADDGDSIKWESKTEEVNF